MSKRNHMTIASLSTLIRVSPRLKRAFTGDKKSLMAQNDTKDAALTSDESASSCPLSDDNDDEKNQHQPTSSSLAYVSPPPSPSSTSRSRGSPMFSTTATEDKVWVGGSIGYLNTIPLESSLYGIPRKDRSIPIVPFPGTEAWGVTEGRKPRRLSDVVFERSIEVQLDENELLYMGKKYDGVDVNIPRHHEEKSPASEPILQADAAATAADLPKPQPNQDGAVISQQRQMSPTKAVPDVVLGDDAGSKLEILNSTKTTGQQVQPSNQKDHPHGFPSGGLDPSVVTVAAATASAASAVAVALITNSPNKASEDDMSMSSDDEEDEAIPTATREEREINEIELEEDDDSVASDPVISSGTHLDDDDDYNTVGLVRSVSRHYFELQEDFACFAQDMQEYGSLEAIRDLCRSILTC